MAPNLSDEQNRILKGVYQIGRKIGIIQLKSNFSSDSLEFLDLKIMIKNGKLETELYVKPTSPT